MPVVPWEEPPTVPADLSAAPHDTYNATDERPKTPWWQKLAVLVVVALLCIAFAGLIWALVF